MYLHHQMNFNHLDIAQAALFEMPVLGNVFVQVQILAANLTEDEEVSLPGPHGISWRPDCQGLPIASLNDEIRVRQGQFKLILNFENFHTVESDWIDVSWSKLASQSIH